MPSDPPDARFSLKDALFNEEKVTWLAQQFKQADTDFKDKIFIREVMHELPNLELKARIVYIAETLERYLSRDFTIAAKQIERALPPPLDPTKTDDDFGSFIIAPLGHVVVRNGLSKQHVHTALQLLKELTKRFSMEDAIRYFINEFPNETLSTLKQWSTDDNYHVRRLVSEGTRPRLPWSSRITIDHTDVMPLLDTLHTDKTRYVTRSVANHLNDIAKSNPALVIETLQRWQKLAAQDANELAWMTRHSLRTLVKQGNIEALRLRGHHPRPNITVNELCILKPTLTIGETLEFSCTITAQATENLLVDYVVDFIKANGSTKPKVFKLKQVAIQTRTTVTLTKRHPLKKNATTFTYYPGKHRVTLQINGSSYHSADFTLLS